MQRTSWASRSVWECVGCMVRRQIARRRRVAHCSTYLQRNIFHKMVQTIAWPSCPPIHSRRREPTESGVMPGMGLDILSSSTRCPARHLRPIPALPPAGDGSKVYCSRRLPAMLKMAKFCIDHRAAAPARHVAC